MVCTSLSSGDAPVYSHDFYLSMTILARDVAGGLFSLYFRAAYQLHLLHYYRPRLDYFNFAMARIFYF